MNAVTEIAYSELSTPEVFDFLANLENLPIWARASSCLDGWLDSSFRVLTRRREPVMRMESDSRTGVIDFWVQSETGAALSRFPMRVMAMGAGGTAISFVLFQVPTLSDKVFARQYAALKHDMSRLPDVLLEHQWIC